MAPKFLLDQFGRSLKNLGLECVDLVYLHNAAESWMPEIGYRRFLERVADVFSLYEKERSEGRLRYYGIASWTCFRVPRGDPEYVSLDDLVEVAKNAGGDDHGFRFIQLPFNPAMSEALSAKSQRIADEPLTTFEAAQKLGLGVFTSAPFGRGQAAEPHEGAQPRGLKGALAPPVRPFGPSRRRGTPGGAEGPGRTCARTSGLERIPSLTDAEFAETMVRSWKNAKSPGDVLLDSLKPVPLLLIPGRSAPGGGRVWSSSCREWASLVRTTRSCSSNPTWIYQGVAVMVVGFLALGGGLLPVQEEKTPMGPRRPWAPTDQGGAVLQLEAFSFSR